MSDRQNIHNESDNYSSAIITAKYTVEFKEDYKWTHRDITYNDSGVPILKIYKGETKRVFKDIYINGKLNNELLVNKPMLAPLDNDENELCEIISNSDENWITIRAINVGTYFIEPTISGTVDLNIYTDIRDTQLIVIIEEEPKPLKLNWTINNPYVTYVFYENQRFDVKLSINILYDNGQTFEIEPDKLEKLTLITSNPYAIYVGEWFCDGSFVYCTISGEKSEERQNTRCRIKVTDTSFKEVFGEDVKNLEPLTIVLNPLGYYQDFLDAKIDVEYDTQPIILDVGSTYTPSIYMTITLEDGRVFKHDISNKYFISKTQDAKIIEFSKDRKVMLAKGVGDVSVESNINYFDDYENEETFLEVPRSIKWDVIVIKTLKDVTWGLDKKTFSVGEDGENKEIIEEVLEDKIELCVGENECILKVIAEYTDKSTEDVLSLCSFNYDDTIIKIEGNRLIPISSGTTELSIYGFEEDKLENKTYTITVIQRLESIDILDDKTTIINDKTLSLYVNDEKQLSYILYPENAIHGEIIWTSSDDTIVSISKEEPGKITALKKGEATIYVGIKPEDREPFEENEDDEDAILPSWTDETANNPTLLMHALCNIEVNEISVSNIDVTDIEVNDNEMTLRVGDAASDIDFKVLPENATNKQVKLLFESDNRYNPVGLNDTDLTIDGQREGSGILKIISVSNPSVIAEIKVTVIDNRIKRIKINNGNDDKYEMYDDVYVYDNETTSGYVISPEVANYANHEPTVKDVKVDKIKYHERWDDDDFPRYYCPINNSLQLSASIEPSNADYANLIWYSSDGRMVKCTENGIITPIKLYNESWDVNVNNDVINDNCRFPNTVWITAFNKKSMKSAVCQVRVTKNHITGFLLGSSPVHDYDVDIFDENGDIKSDLPKPIEYKQDYVLWRGETETLPLTILVEDSNFGPSNNFEWFGTLTHINPSGNGIIKAFDWTDIVSLKNHTISHDNKEDEFDWTGIDPERFNNDKKNLNIEMTGVGLGSVMFQAICNDKYYTPKSVSTDVSIGTRFTDKDGQTSLNDIFVTLNYDFMHYDTIKIAALPISGACINLIETFTSKYLHVVLPRIYVPIIVSNKKEIFMHNPYDFNHEMTSYHLNVSITEGGPNGDPVDNVKIYVEYYVSEKTGDVKYIKNTISNGFQQYPFKDMEHITNKQLSSELSAAENEIKDYITYEATEVEDSREIKVTVVDSPKDIYLCIMNNSLILTKGLPEKNLTSVWPEAIKVKIKKYKHHNYSVPLFIKFDDAFVESLQEYSGKNNECPLDDKYMSFAWFTSNPKVFVPIECTQAPEQSDRVTILEEVKYYETLDVWKPIYNLKGYGRYMHILPTGTGVAKLTIVNIMSGQSWERLIEVVE